MIDRNPTPAIQTPDNASISVNELDNADNDNDDVDDVDFDMESGSQETESQTVGGNY